MKNLIHISKIKHKNAKEFDAYYSIDDDCFEFFRFENGVYNLVDPFELDYIPEEYELDYIDDINQYNLNPQNKKHNKLIIALKAATATILTGITITSAYPKILKILDYTIMKSTTIFTTADLVNKNTTSEEFKKLFSESLQSNNEFTQEEKDVISTGYQKFLDDWGYLLDETQKEYILYKAQNLKVFEEEIENDRIAGYYDKNITVENREWINVTTHEAAHGFSDHGATNGARSIFLGRAINEALNTAINSKYISEEWSYEYERQIAFFLEQLVGAETLVKFYATRDFKIDSLINAIKENCPGASTMKIIKFIATLDLQNELHSQGESYDETTEKLRESALEQFKYFFKLKNGIDIENTWLYEIGNFNVLDKEVVLEIIDDLKLTVYIVPREILNKPKTYDISSYYKEIKHANGVAGFVLSSLTLEQEKLEAKSKKELIEIVEKKLENNPDFYAKFQSLKSYIKNYSIPEDSQDINNFVELTLNTLLSQEKDPQKLACLLKDFFNSTKKYLLDSTRNAKIAEYNNAIVDKLKKLNLTDVLYYYSYTTIYWDKNNKKEVSKEYEELSDCYDYKFIPGESEGCLIIRVPENKIPYSVNFHEIDTFKIPIESEIYKEYKNILGNGKGDIYMYTTTPDLEVVGSVKLINDKGQLLEETATIKM